MLADMRARGTTDEKLKELITAENFEKYKAISRPSSEAQVKSEMALKEVARQQDAASGEPHTADRSSYTAGSAGRHMRSATNSPRAPSLMPRRWRRRRDRDSPPCVPSPYG